jgi:hypothetical protein
MSFEGVGATGCMILDDDELEAASKRLEWRTGNSFEVRSLFRSPVVAKPFQMVRKFPPPTSGFGGAGSVAGKFPFQRSERKIAGRPPAVAGNSEPASEFKPLMEVDWNPTPEEIAEFGVPLLPMPLAPVMRPVPFPDIDEEMAEIDDSIYFEDGDPRYAACTPPPGSRVSPCDPLRVSEEETTAPAIDTKDVVGLGPDVNVIVGDLRKSD